MLNLSLHRLLRGANRRNKSGKLGTGRPRGRLARVEQLEARHLLTSLAAIPDQTLSAGAPLEIPINVSNPSSFPLTYSVTSSNPTISTSLPSGNPDLVLNITHTSSGQPGDTSFSGTLIIELFPGAAPTAVQQIENLTNAGAYNGKTFYRVVNDFVAQAGLSSATPPPSANVHTLDDEFNPVLPASGPNEPLRYTSIGVLGLARQTPHDTGSTEFFLTTSDSSSFLDYNYSIFGQLVSGYDILSDINNVPNDSSNNNLPDSPVTITSASIVTDNNDLALGISAPVGATGSGSVTVTANDGHGGISSQTFQVTVQADPNDPGPFIETTAQSLNSGNSRTVLLNTTLNMTVNTPLTFTLPTFDLHGDPLTFSNQTSGSITGLGVSVDPSTGIVTLTPSSGLTAGVKILTFGVSGNGSNPDTQAVPVFVNPAAPLGISLVAASDTGASSSDGITSRNNSSAAQELQFTVTGVTVGDTVQIFDGSTLIGQLNNAQSSTVTVTTNGTTALSSGSHQITAKQALLNQSWTAGNRVSASDLISNPTAAVAITVAGPPVFTSTAGTTATVGSQFSYQPTVTDAVQTGLQWVLVGGPTGVNVNSTTGQVTWTPTVSQLGTSAITIRVLDVAGNTTNQSFNVTVFAGPTVTGVSTPAAAGSNFQVGQSLTINVTFSEAVNVTGAGLPQLTLNDGAVVNFTIGSGTNTLQFLYTVAAGESTADLDYASISALALNGATIKDSAGNVANLTLPATGTNGLATKDIVIGNPQILADLQVALTVGSSSALAGGTLGYTVTVTNNGPVAAQNVALSDTLPAGTTFASQSQSSGPAFALSASGNVIHDTISTLAPGASAIITIVANVSASASVGALLTNTATVSAATSDPNLQNNSASASATVIGSGVVLTTDPTNPTKMELLVVGTSGNDNISFTLATGGKISVVMDKKTYGPFAVTGRLVAYGEAGNDVITVGPAITLTAYLYSGTGNDQLTGGGGNNVLVGGGGSDTLIGGKARNLLIAGSGTSKLYSTPVGAAVGSNSGSILIGGSTDYDSNDTALATIMAEWGSTDAYTTRVNVLKSGSLAGGVALTAAHIHQNKAIHDQLYASAGFDWFLDPGLFDQILGLTAQKKSQIKIN